MLEVSDLKIDLHPLQESFWEETYDDIVELVLSKMFIKTLELAALTNNVFQRLYGKKKHQLHDNLEFHGDLHDNWKWVKSGINEISSYASKKTSLFYLHDLLLHSILSDFLYIVKSVFCHNMLVDQ